MKGINYDEIITQMKSELETDSALANKYGIVLGSTIDAFPKERVIPQKILELISDRMEIAEELGLQKINSFALESEKYIYLFTFSERLILISKLGLNVNLATFMPSIGKFLKKLSRSVADETGLIKPFSEFEFKKEINKIESSIKEEGIAEEKYKIIKKLVNFIAK
ncbi:MAG: hypothetical protein ACOC44_13960 [Promethearchaeia archaeon]